MQALRNGVAEALGTLRWMPSYVWQRITRSLNGRSLHLMITVANHFEPEISADAPRHYVPLAERERRVEHWCRGYARMADPWRDADGQPLRQTYFYPAEHYDKGLIDRLAEHCRQGWGEIEIHLHHGVEQPDTSDNTRRTLVQFRDLLSSHGCLSREDGNGPPRYAFVHGNWALANSAGGRFCGVDQEMRILAETGCYADLTLPSAPDRSQIAKINALYECALPLDQRAPHRRGRDLCVGRTAPTLPLIVQGPLGLNFRRRLAGWPIPGVENGALTAAYPPTMDRFRLWTHAAISVRGRPEWLFIKLHSHGMNPADTSALLGEPVRAFLRDLTHSASREGSHVVHFVAAREMVNIILAACDGRGGDPGQYRDYRFRLDR